MKIHHHKLVLALVVSFATVAFCATDPSDLDVLNQFRKGLQNPELLQWPKNGDDPCGPPSWKHVFCSKSRVTQIQVQGLGLKGPLPQNFNKLSSLANVGLQKNRFSGPLPSFSGLSNLQYAYLDFNNFDLIPVDFFDGLTSLQVLALDGNNFNASTGWSFPKALQDSLGLFNLSCMSCNLVGPLPDFLGSMSSLTNLRLSNNGLSGEIPGSFKGMGLKTLWLNNQQGGGFTGQIDVVATMASLETLWLHGNQFSGTIPESIGNLTVLKDLNLNGNRLVGLVPDSLANMVLNNLDLNNNQLMGPIPKFKAAEVTYSSNPFCQSKEGIPCASEVMALIDFLGGLNYPSRFVSDWSGNDPCRGSWLGLRCNVDGKVEIINMPNFNLTGELSPSVAKLESLTQIRLQSNLLSGPIPPNWTSLKLLKTLDLSNNNIGPPLPKFSSTVNLVLVGNPLLKGNTSGTNTSPGTSGSPSDNGSSGGSSTNPKNHKRSKLFMSVVPTVCVCTMILVAIPLYIYCCTKRKGGKIPLSSVVIKPSDPNDLGKMVKIVVANKNTGTSSTQTGTSNPDSINSSETHVIESGNLVISVQILKQVTKGFSHENELGRGGFGAVYKGELEDGKKIAVKRMESGVITSSKALDEFQAEIRVLSKVRHRHLVSLLGYSIEGNERLLVYEYMPLGALSKHLFQWKSLKLEPLSWKKRLNIALDVARAMEYLHSLAHRSFIHRDLKSSNILLDDDFRAKVSDFGLVKLAPDSEKSVVTRLAGTFGYLAPEYAVTGKVTTKVDVFSFGVVLMELLTGLTALDEDRPEESHYLASYFWHIKSDKEKLRTAIDKTLEITDETFEGMSVVSALAGYCTAREPSQRPDMSHAVNMLSQLVEKWKPTKGETGEDHGDKYGPPLDQMVKGWRESEASTTDVSYIDLGDSKGSIPTRPEGFAESFTSADGR